MKKNLLSKKEQNCGSGIPLKWVASCLKNIKQYVESINEKGNVKSKELTINSGVPQGSILSPLFFIFYITNLQLT